LSLAHINLHKTICSSPRSGSIFNTYIERNKRYEKYAHRYTDFKRTLDKNIKKEISKRLLISTRNNEDNEP